MVRLLVPVDEPDDDDGSATAAEPPPYDKNDPMARVMWEMAANYLPPGPPYDLAERLTRTAKDATFLIDEVTSARRGARVQMARAQAYEDALRKIVMAADCGRSLTKPLEAARELLPPSRYKRPPR